MNANAKYAYERGVKTGMDFVGPFGDGTWGNYTREHLNNLASESGCPAAWWDGFEVGSLLRQDAA